MKRKSLLVGLGVGVISLAQAQEEYNVNGIVKPTPKDLTVHMYYQHPGGGLKHDSSKVVDGKFNFHGDLPSVALGFLVVLKDGESLNQYMNQHLSLPPDQIGIYLEKGDIKVDVEDNNNLQSVKISGTFNNNAVQDVRPLLWKYKNEEAALNARLKAADKDSVKSNAIVQEYYAMVKRRTVDVGTYVKAHPNALASLDILKRWVLPTDDLQNAKKYFACLGESLRNSRSATMYANAIKQSEAVDINSMAPNFALKDTSGIAHELNQYKGKYVLIDFWASWCGPCLQEMPNVVDAYNKFKAKNFEILGVSLDGNAANAKDKWIAAIGKNNMTWPQVSDLLGWNSPVAHSYMLTSIPMNFLLDPNGKIIAKNLRGEELVKVLNQYL